ncbi:MAG: class I SAM-dependent methyltransferase [Ardenticatenaceae bacterium]
MISSQTQIIVASETRHFRHQAQKMVTAEDFFLEIGCSFGECTRLFAKLGLRGVSVDHSSDAVTRARQLLGGYAGISVVQADARDIEHIRQICPAPSVILIDIGGNERLPKVTSLLRLVLKTFRPRLILVKSMELAELSSIIQVFSLPNVPHLLAPLEESSIPHQLIDLSKSPLVNDRLFALQRLRRSVEQNEVLKRIEEMRHDENGTVRKRAIHILENRNQN